jgi:hypothetical protein
MIRAEPLLHNDQHAGAHPLRIAIIGIRGVPATYGGLEECAEQVGARLAARGHEVLVYCRKGTFDDTVREYKDCFYHFYQRPRVGEVYNIGGSRHSNCSMREAIALCEQIAGKKMQATYVEQNRSGDHIWWISDVRRFQSHYPGWQYHYDIRRILTEIAEGLESRLGAVSPAA